MWGLLFVAIGLYFAFGRIIVARREARRTRYVVTDQRVLILAGTRDERMTEMALTDLPPVQLEQRSSGIGTINFGASSGFLRVPPGWPTMGVYGQPTAFVSVRDAARVYQIVQDARSAARGAAI